MTTLDKKWYLMSTPAERDTCGIPSKANWYVHVVLANLGETTDTDVYVCDEHMPAVLGLPTLVRPGDRAIFDSWADPDNGWADAARALLKWDGNEGWSIVSVDTTRLR